MFNNDRRRVFGGVIEIKDVFNTLYLMSAFASNDISYFRYKLVE